MDQCDYDVIVIGAGLGGLLTAAQFLRRGQRVVVVERLAHPGGRFTAKTFQGAQVSTGAVHMLPFGSNGELAGMLRRLEVPHRVHDSEVFASFHVRGRQYVCRSLFQLLAVLGPRQFAELGRLGAEMYLRRPAPAERGLAYADWLARRISRARSPEVWAFFERICHFALSVDMGAVSYPEVVETSKNMFRYGAPGVVDGGCAAVTGELERRVLAGGGALRMRQDVVRVLSADGRATGIEVRDKATGALTRLSAPLIVSNIGPEATRRLIAGETTAAASAPDGVAGPEAGTAPRVASGLKVHLLSDHSIIPHRGIMYCLDTERIAGIVQPSNSDRRLAPPGQHLLITHQLMRGDDVNAEREAARADLRRLFGDDFGTRVRILTMSQYRGEWPVNRIAQGEDVAPVTDLAGLYLVGDAVKPSGYLMVEGVAQSVNALLDEVDRLGPPLVAAPVTPVAARRSHMPARPGIHRALYWLVAPPRPDPRSSRPIEIPMPSVPEPLASGAVD
ncbi:MAG TPA: FAD-dependent oxidoreductase [Ktedonobacterales bacterium]|nr:FAD-dependent oxidoreductase [Ktedonobacterales bacterium]